MPRQSSTKEALISSSLTNLLWITVCPVTSRRRKGETSSMSSSKSLAPCCQATPERWTSPLSCRKASTSCVNTKVRCFHPPLVTSRVYVELLAGWRSLTLFLGLIIHFAIHSTIRVVYLHNLNFVKTCFVALFMAHGSCKVLFDLL